MLCCIPTLLLLLLFVLVVRITLAVSLPDGPSDASEVMCHDWGESSNGPVSVLEGEVGWLSCPLFSHPSVYNYNTSQMAGQNLVWYRFPEGQDMEQPIRSSWRLTKDRERLWLQPAAIADGGLYICMLRNKSSCTKIAMRLKVVRPDEVVRVLDCEPPVAVEEKKEIIHLQEDKVLDCPNLQDAAKMADGEPSVTWEYVNHKNEFHLPNCQKYPFWNKDPEQVGARLHFYSMMASYQGSYYCRVQYQRKSRVLNFTRRINVTAVYSRFLPKHPSIINPGVDQTFTVRQNTEVRLVCKALFPYLNSSWHMGWTVDGKTPDRAPDQHRFSQVNRQLKLHYGDRTEESVLIIQDFQAKDMDRDFSCSVKNPKGFESRRAVLKLEVSLPSVELGCGLGVTLFLMLFLFIVYHVFWLELLLLYRSWFGTDERHTDDKEYDVYISYARNSEEEEFVLMTLRSVLENELGYTVCIFDRDSLPGGTITDETLSFVARSRRLLVVISPGYASQGSQALLELKAGIDGMARGGHLRVILIQYKPVQRQAWVRELKRARVALALVRWKGDKSKELTSHFWKKLRVELPVRELVDQRGQATMRLNSISLQTGLINLSEAILHSMQRSRHLLFVLSPNLLVEKSFSLLECRLGLYLQHGHRASIVTVVRRSVTKLPCVEVAQLRQAATTTVTWRGRRSEPHRSRFWLRLRLALPVRPLSMGRRLIDSSSTHSDLAAMAAQRAQLTQKLSRRDGANQRNGNRRSSGIQNHRDGPVQCKGRSQTRRAGSGEHSRSCSRCFNSLVEDRGAELRVETSQVSHDRTDGVSVKESAITIDSTHGSPNPAPMPDSTLPTCQQDDEASEHEQQQVIEGIDSRTSEEKGCPQGKGRGL